jgi:hypothetical protein
MSTIRTEPELYLEVCSGNDPRYMEIRREHYVTKAKGVYGQQFHFLVLCKGERVGIISGASAAYACAPRDGFFGITKANRKKCLNGIIDNVIFRLKPEYCGKGDHLANKIVLLWEQASAYVWKQLYGVEVFGFETFVLEEGYLQEVETDETDKSGRPLRRVDIVADPTGKNIRRGGTYRGTGWREVGQTAGSAKKVFCKWRSGFSAPIESEYCSTWMAATPKGTPEMKDRAKRRAAFRRTLLGTRFYIEGKALIQGEPGHPRCAGYGGGLHKKFSGGRSSAVLSMSMFGASATS